VSPRRRRGLCLAGALLVACATSASVEPAAPSPPLAIRLAVADEVFPGTRVDLDGDGFLWGSAGETAVWFDGALDGRPVAFSWPALEVTPRRIRLGLTPAVRASLPAAAGRLSGLVRIELRPRDQPGAIRRGAVSLDVVLREAPRPVLTAVDPGPQPPGAVISIAATDLVDGDEGRTLLELDGQFFADDGPRDVPTVRLPLTERRGRTQGVFSAPALAFGLDVGRFEGRARLLIEGPAPAQSAWLTNVTIVQDPPELPPPPPLTISRGRTLRLEARGALPLDAAAQTSTAVRLVGTFQPDTGAAYPLDLHWMPEDVEPGRSVRLALRTRGEAIPGDTPPAPGPGLRPGRFTGEIGLVVRVGRAVVRSEPVPWTLTVERDHQAVHLDVRPGFRDGLARFGLAAAESAVLERILAVCVRDFDGLRLDCATTPPADTIEFVTVELGGEDPNGIGLFGLEASVGKDVGNRRLDERIGGYDPESEAHGGIFLDSFLALSPGAAAPSPLAEPVFDAVFSEFSPELSAGAVPYDPAVDRPGTSRHGRAAEAIRVLGALVGTTVTHELGHVLGLSAASDGVHNPGDWPGDLMDAGEYRPLAERAELAGHLPGRFTGPNAHALARILGDP
jgi:hypothetical protein